METTTTKEALMGTDLVVGDGLRFDPVYLGALRKGDLILLGTVPGFVTATVTKVERVSITDTGREVDITVRVGEREMTNPAYVEFRNTGKALVLRPSGCPGPLGDERARRGF